MPEYQYMQDVITDNQTWFAPGARDDQYAVSLWGGGGAGSVANFYNNIGGAGGGSGYMNQGTFTIKQGDRVDIIIGEGGRGADTSSPEIFANSSIGQSGGTSFFGSYLSASGGQGGCFGKGGIGGFNGGAPGLSGEGNYGSFGVIATKDGTTYESGGGGSAIGARGTGGCANMSQGDGGTAAGGAGCLVTHVNNAGIHMRTGSGGQGVCVIRYYRPL